MEHDFATMPQLTLAAWVRYTGLDRLGSRQVLSQDDGRHGHILGLDECRGGYVWSVLDSIFPGRSGWYMLLNRMLTAVEMQALYQAHWG